MLDTRNDKNRAVTKFKKKNGGRFKTWALYGTPYSMREIKEIRRFVRIKRKIASVPRWIIIYYEMGLDDAIFFFPIKSPSACRQVCVLTVYIGTYNGMSLPSWGHNIVTYRYYSKYCRVAGATRHYVLRETPPTERWKRRGKSVIARECIIMERSYYAQWQLLQNPGKSVFVMWVPAPTRYLVRINLYGFSDFVHIFSTVSNVRRRFPAVVRNVIIRHYTPIQEIDMT